MMDESTIKKVQKYLATQPEIQERFLKVHRRMHKPVMLRIAREMHVAPGTLDHFSKGFRRVALQTLWSIEIWVKRMEEEQRNEFREALDNKKQK